MPLRARSRRPAAIGPVIAGSLPDGLDVEDERYGLIGLFDVLEHVEHDAASLAALGKKLMPDGRLVLSVPALPWLWSEHDVAHHHFRRYTVATLRQTIAQAGLTADGIGYFNAILFPVALVQRLVQKTTGLGKGAGRNAIANGQCRVAPGLCARASFDRAGADVARPLALGRGPAMTPLVREVLRFASVGAGATLVHLVVALAGQSDRRARSSGRERVRFCRRLHPLLSRSLLLDIWAPGRAFAALCRASSSSRRVGYALTNLIVWS